ncbi:hypothetical protein CYMTET_4063 [Cymbomonas tetramitiformis]|uniref:MAM domain-containing protein n=1 Tax=Cymbomonas tetramitiformis TaxID=36881 RepID=A0AAE0H245_9CHLO|nr:hypothetical protein CYMTET_4063 [Cymbomonas tetramitiformis]
MPPTAGNLVASSDSVTSVPTKEEDIATRNFGDNGNQKLVQHSSEISQLQRSAMTRSTGVLIHETFETGTLGIFTSSDSGFWKVHNRSTASSNTGPVGGDNSKYYVHAESSANFPTRTEYLTSNVFTNGYKGDAAIDSIMVQEYILPSTTPTSADLYVQEDFESGSLGIFTASDEAFWRVGSGSTPSSNTGPASAYEGTHYAFSEATGHASHIQYLTTGHMSKKVGNIPRISFAYNMYGSDMGTLAVEVQPAGSSSWTELWSQTGEAYNMTSSGWLVATVIDSSGVTQSAIDFVVRFKMTIGLSYRSDAAIDYVSLREIQPPTSSPTVSSLSPTVSLSPTSESPTSATPTNAPTTSMPTSTTAPTSTYSPTASPVATEPNFAFGRNNYGQLGDGTTSTRYTPERVMASHTVARLAAGSEHSLFLTSHGEVFSCGSNGNGQVGDGSTSTRYTPVQVMASHTVAQVAAGYQHSLFRTVGGQVYACGDNNYGQLGDGSRSDRYSPVGMMQQLTFTDVAAGGYHTLLLTDMGRVFGCGSNGDGRLGDGTTTTRYSPVGMMQQLTFTDVAAGGYHTLLLTDMGRVFGCGSNGDGQLGDGTTTTTRYSPVGMMQQLTFTDVAAGGYHTLLLTDMGRVFGCGSNGDGQLGDGTTTTRNGQLGTGGSSYYIYSPVRVMTAHTVTGISAGSSHSLFRTEAGEVHATGYNGYGQLGDGTTSTRYSPVQQLTFTDVAAGGYHTLLLTDMGRVFGCGSNGDGRLGDGTTTTRYTPVQVMSEYTVSAISASLQRHSLFLTADGQTYACGYGYYGQLGTGSSSYYIYSPQLTFTDVAAGGYHTLLLTDMGRVFGCGSNGDGRLGDGTTTTRYSPVGMMQQLTFTDVAAGGYHTLLLTDMGRVFGCGSNGDGQLGDGTTTTRYGQLGDGSGSDRYTPVQVMSEYTVSAISASLYKHSLFLTADGQTYACGYGSNGQLGTGSSSYYYYSPVRVMTAHTVTGISAGYYHSLFRTEAGEVHATGNNYYGQLGDGTTSTRYSPVQVLGSYGEAADLAAGSHYSLAAGATGMFSTNACLLG